jgi:uncharacterized protein YdgA (DUF945 family)
LGVVNHSNGLYAEVVSYQRGWFQSHALLDWSIHVPTRTVTTPSGQAEVIPAQDYQVEMPLTIYHGPIIYSDRGVMFGLGYAHTDLTMPQKVLEQFNDYFTAESTQPKMDISLFVDYLNNSQINMNIPQFNLIAKEGKMQFNWMGMTTGVKTTSSLSEVKGAFNIEGIGFLQNQVNLVVGEITGKYNLHKTRTGLFYGDASSMVPSVVIKINDEKIFELTDFSVDTATTIKKDLFSSSFSTSMKKLILNGRVFGPGHLDVAIKNLDADVLAHINEAVSKAQQGTDLEKQQAMLSVLPLLPKLFAQGAVFDISTINLVVPEGDVSGDLHIALPAGVLTNPFELLQKIEGSGNLKLPALLMKEMVTQSIKQKLLSKAADTTPSAVTTPASGASATQGNIEQQQQPATKAASANTAVGNMSVDDIMKQAEAQTDQQVAAMLQSGVLVQQGSDYMISIKLSNGQFVVNDKPFNPAMIKF